MTLRRRIAFKELAKNKLAQRLTTRVRASNFSTLYQTICMEMDPLDHLR